MVNKFIETLNKKENVDTIQRIKNKRKNKFEYTVQVQVISEKYCRTFKSSKKFFD